MIRMISNTKRFGLRFPSRGMTYVELMVALAIFAMIGVVVVYFTVAAAYAGREGLFLLSTESKARYALDGIRRDMLAAEFTTVQVFDNGRRIRFWNPTYPELIEEVPSTSPHYEMYLKKINSGEYRKIVDPEESETQEPATGATGEYRFANGVLTYTLNVATGRWQTNYTGLSDVRFELQENGSLLFVEVKATGLVRADEPRVITLTDLILLRNVPVP